MNTSQGSLFDLLHEFTQVLCTIFFSSSQTFSLGTLDFAACEGVDPAGGTSNIVLGFVRNTPQKKVGSAAARAISLRSETDYRACNRRTSFSSDD